MEHLNLRAVLKGSWQDRTLSAEERLEELEAQVASNYNRIRIYQSVWGSAKLSSYILQQFPYPQLVYYVNLVLSNKQSSVAL